MNLVCEQELKQIFDIIEMETDKNCVNFGGLRLSMDNRSLIASSSGDITETMSFSLLSGPTQPLDWTTVLYEYRPKGKHGGHIHEYAQTTVNQQNHTIPVPS